ncbi:radical SAM domain protein [Lentisphaera araneosa HTCC2155]|uniref:Radical SAM domain protein n=1 Tax=Lentisphaera araneosa HTCC2155 TaxID=313628 RepID=A6DJY1_9BACT|nr:aminofutalosine synthase MqnE [Lentisphaera araneosa]EDM28205.1 radical SAM domain protein [Lentisphaera araneosa HTCC2155]
MSKIQEIYGKVERQERISEVEAVCLYEDGDLATLQKFAHQIRSEKHQDKTFYNRNIHFEPTNKCVYACKFCSFARKPKATEEEGAWDYGTEELKEQLDKYPVGSLTEVHITGGVHPDRGVDFGEELVSFIKRERPEIHVKAFTAVEVTWMAKLSKLSVKETLTRLRNAGLDSLPGGGAEIFDSSIRRKIAGGKAPADRWLEVHGEAHRVGLSSNATMLYGHIEDYSHRVDHMSRLRQLQDETGGFNSFIPLRYRNENNSMSNLKEVSLDEDMRNFAVARIFLDNIPHLKAYWVMLGVEEAFKALDYGVDDMDGTVDDSTKIYSMAGSIENPALSRDYLCSRIAEHGFKAVERNSVYEEI